MFFSPDISVLDEATLKDREQTRFIISMWFSSMEINNPLALNIFEKGVRPEYPGVSENDFPGPALSDWFIDRLTADIDRLSTASKEQFERYLDVMDLKSSQALFEWGSVAAKYDLYPADYNDQGIKKITDVVEREKFERYFLNEAVCNSAFMVLAHIFYKIHGELYAVKT